jgi:predicted phosphodiesterase
MNGKIILTADWHLRADKPQCRLDEDWEFIQKKTIRSIVQDANHNKADLCIVGDLFHKPVVPPRIAIMFIHAMKQLKTTLHIIPGNHDLPYHSIKNIDDSTIGIVMKIMGYTPEFEDILFLHQLIFKSKEDMPPNSKAKTAKEILSQYPDYKWIFTGDNHQAFIYKHKDRYLVNPGCILRQKADLKDYFPRYYLIDLEKETIETRYIADEAELVTDVYLRTEEERKERIAAFVEIVEKSGSVSLDFIDNLESGYDSIDPEVVGMIKEIMEELDDTKRTGRN